MFIPLFRGSDNLFFSTSEKFVTATVYVTEPKGLKPGNRQRYQDITRFAIASRAGAPVGFQP